MAKKKTGKKPSKHPRRASTPSGKRKNTRTIPKVALFPIAAIVLLVIVFLTTREETRKSNLLLITLDTVRTDRLSCYGSTILTTPALDRIAERGVLFEQAIAPAPMTLPSHATVMTGLYPQRHGVRANGAFRLSNRAITLAEILRNNGYRTAAVIGSFILDSSYGLSQGFDYYDDEMVSSPADIPGSQGQQGQLMKITPRPASEVTSRSLSWLARAADKPFFLWIHYYDPHYPYEPPPPYSDTFADDLYTGEIAFVDDNVDRILDMLEEKKLLDQTLIIVASDHGEGLGDHREKTHSVFVYEPMIRVPFIISQPEHLPAGKRIDVPVSLADILPTVLDLFDLEYALELDGRSLAPTIREEAEKDRLVYSESMFSHLTYGWSRISSLQGSRWKYIRSSTPELYDLSEDPAEERNLVDTRTDIVELFNTRLDSLMEEEPPEGLLSEKMNPTLKERERLAALGYVTASSEYDSGASLRDPKDMIRYHLLVDAGNKAIDRGRYAEALESFNEVLSMAENEVLDPSMEELLGMVYNRLGVIAINQDDMAEARENFEKSVEHDPDLLDAQYNLGNMLLMNGEYRRAAERYERALEIDSGHAASMAQLSNVYLQLGDTLRAQEFYRRARSLGPSPPR